MARKFCYEFPLCYEYRENIRFYVLKNYHLSPPKVIFAL